MGVRHELEERRVVVMERSDVVGVDEGAGEVDAGDAVGGALEQARKLEPAPGAVAGTVHQDKVAKCCSVALKTSLPASILNKLNGVETNNIMLIFLKKIKVMVWALTPRQREDRTHTRRRRDVM